MSNRPSAINGKRNRAWGTRDACPACGQCLCFGCHPAGPCVDERDHAAASDHAACVSAGVPSLRVDVPGQVGAWIVRQQPAGSRQLSD